MRRLTFKTQSGDKLLVAHTYCDCEDECSCSTEFWLDND